MAAAKFKSKCYNITDQKNVIGDNENVAEVK